uniref:Uncharacterized protein n=1 Tax=viral metagenome TaxID=1070528 RepID=A0A6M3LBM9_9ZZZZ
MPLDEKYTCSTCNGTCRVNDRLCTTCFGEGALPLRGIVGVVCREMFMLFQEAETKLDNIIAEQVSQREDLTNTLTAIWNKVKDL